MAADTTSKSLQGITELTLVAAVKPGLIRALDTRSHASRLKTVMTTLQGLRASSREWALVRPLSDAVERIQAIQTFRVALLDGDRLLLAVTFDRPWEPYIRFIWQDLGPLLDLLFCNCVGYPLAATTPFADYARWIRAQQIEADFFYAASAATVSDGQIQRLLEQRVNDEPPREHTDLVFERPEAAAQRISSSQPDQGLSQGLVALGFLHRLRELYAHTGTEPDGADDGVLRRATHALLKELKAPPLRDELDRAGRNPRYAAALAWFTQPLWAPEPPVPVAPVAPVAQFDRSDVQGGIVSAYDHVRQGCLLLIELTGSAGLDQLLRRVSICDDAGVANLQVGVRTNIAFTLTGLRKLGLTAAELERLPKEFREGMEARAGLLGDVRDNHPRRWNLPRRYTAGDPLASNPTPDAPPVPLSAVDVVLQMRLVGGPDQGAPEPDFLLDAAHPLRRAIDALVADGTDGTDVADGADVDAGAPQFGLLSLQPLLSHVNPQGQAVGHFNLVDGISQPRLEADTPISLWQDQVRLGEILLGYVNDRNDPAPADDSDALLANGSFLVIRKLRQDVSQLAALQSRGQAQGVSPDVLMAKMLGRWPDGTPLLGGGADAQAGSGHEPRKGQVARHGQGPNDFDFSSDPSGQHCPFQSHVRRTNPRNGTPEHPIPRLMRRGMSYGPLAAAYGSADSGADLGKGIAKVGGADAGTDSAPEVERGLVFMAYNARIAEQFEVIQRWIAGGNSAGGSSAHSDPFLGLPQRGEARVLRLVDDSVQPPQVRRVVLHDGGDSAPMVKLEWGLYLLAPSLTALADLRQRRSGALPLGLPALDIQPVLTALAGLQAVNPAAAELRWKALLEDIGAKQNGSNAALWTRVRQDGGAMACPLGVLVGSKDLLFKVLKDEARYSVSGYMERMRQSFGPIFLGMDAGPAYQAQAAQVNRALLDDVTAEQAFADARACTGEVLAGLQADQAGADRSQLTFHVKELVDGVLARLCRRWFDLPDGVFVHQGGWEPSADVLRCPGHFTSPSRYFFSPAPAAQAEQFGQQHGQALLAAVTEFVRRHSPSNGPLPLQGRLSRSLFALVGNPDQLARTLIGAMMGFLPTTDGTLRSVLYDWIEQRTLWALQAALAKQAAQDRAATADAAVAAALLPPAPIAPVVDQALARARAILMPELMRSMQARPVPDVVWRTARVDHVLGNVAVKAGQRVILGIVSSTHEDLQKGRSSIDAVFGGQRRSAGAPTHACPGRDMATAALLGVFTGLLEAGELRSAGAPLFLSLIWPQAAAAGAAASTSTSTSTSTSQTTAYSINQPAAAA